MKSACRQKSTVALGTACLLVDFRRQWHSECMNALSTFVDSGSERVKLRHLQAVSAKQHRLHDTILVLPKTRNQGGMLGNIGTRYLTLTLWMKQQNSRRIYLLIQLQKNNPIHHCSPDSPLDWHFLYPVRIAASSWSSNGF